MPRSTEEIRADALAMPDADRARLAQDLIVSLDGPSDPDAEVAWQQEIDRRLREVRDGTVEMIPWESVRDSLRGRARASD